MAYAIYLRKSRADVEMEALGEMETLARHEKILTELAKRQGLQIGRIYKEIVSGESIEDRPKMKELIEDVYSKKWKGVLVMEVERLARGDTRDQGTVAEAFKYSNTLIITPVKTYDPTNQYDEEYFEFGLFMSRREYKTIQRRLQTGKMQSIKEGNYMGSLPPYGYDVIRPNKKERTLALNDQSKYVVMIFEWFVNDRMTVGEISRKLTSMGVPTRTGKREWHRGTIIDILKNNLYTGKIRWNRRRVTKEFVEGSLKRTKRRQTSEDYLIVDGKHPALITEEMFEKAQSLFTCQAPVKAMTKMINPLSRLMYCKHCGKAVGMQYFKKRETTPARYVHKESTTCSVKSSYASDVIDAIIQGLKMYVEDFEFKMNNEGYKQEQERHHKIVEDMEKELTKINNQRTKLFEYLEDGIYTKEEFAERKGVLTEKIDSLSKAIKEEKKNAPQQVDYTEKIIKFSEVIESLQDDKIDARHKNDLLKDIIKRIEYDCIDYGRNKGGKPVLDIFLK